MSNAYKMWYFKANVIGEEANLINHLAITEKITKRHGGYLNTATTTNVLCWLTH